MLNVKLRAEQGAPCKQTLKQACSAAKWSPEKGGRPWQQISIAGGCKALAAHYPFLLTATGSQQPGNAVSTQNFDVRQVNAGNRSYELDTN